MLNTESKTIANKVIMKFTDIKVRTAKLANAFKYSNANRTGAFFASSGTEAYLEAITQQLADTITAIDRLAQDEEKHGRRDFDDHLLSFLEELENSDNLLRQKYGLGERYSFIRKSLDALISETKLDLESLSEQKQSKGIVLAENECIVYVYLFNAKGNNLRNWQNMLTQDSLGEYAINRPIYAEQERVVSLINSKPDKLQHAFLKVIVAKEDIVESPEPLQDKAGVPLLKLKEDSLHINRVLGFVHDDKEYVLSKEGKLQLHQSITP